ncbi:hypothetical protein F183_A27820 [Bryobacterales bacterium F-183]|nr:hypothetical protein F183_A27820 [Bryobacterales bacterium F-183]
MKKPAAIASVLLLGLACFWLYKPAASHGSTPPALSSLNVKPDAIFYPSKDGSFIATDFSRSARYTATGITYSSGLQVSFVGTLQNTSLHGIDQQITRVNLIDGQSRTSHPAYGAIEYRNLYDGVAMRCRLTNQSWKSDFLLDPGTDPATIRMQYKAIGPPKVEPDGSLRVLTASGEMRERIPEVYQLDKGRKIARSARYVLRANAEVGLAVDRLDASMPTVIDPDLTYATFWSGNRNQAITSTAFGSDDSIYLAGWTESSSPVGSSPFQGTNRGGTDGFVARLSPNGSTLLWATFLGGSGVDRINAMALDSVGRPVVAGSTSSFDFPRQGPMQTSLRGAMDGFVARLTANGSVLDFSTYYGGSGVDIINAIAVDAGGIYGAGQTTSNDFPLTAALYGSPRGGQDGFAFKLDTAASTALYSTYIGGAGDDAVLSMDVWQQRMFLTGVTTSSNLPVVAGLGPRGGMDGFFITLNSSATAPVVSTYLGGSAGSSTQPEMGNAIRVTSSGEAVIGGITPSADFPVTTGASQTQFGRGGADGFLVKYSQAGTSVQWATFLGGNSYDAVNALAIRNSGQIVVTGATGSPSFPVNQSVQASYRGFYDAFVTLFSPQGAVIFSSLWGGDGVDSGAAIATGKTNANLILFAGSTSSVNITMAASATPYQTAGNNGGISGFAAIIRQAGGAVKPKDKIGVFHTHNQGWALDRNGDFSWTIGDVAFPLGAPGDLPVVGDWDGTGVFRVGMFRSGVWYFDMNGDNAWTWGTDAFAYFGTSGDIPVVGDWTGSGRSMIGLYRNGTWVLDWDGSNSWTGSSDRIFSWGDSTYIPVVGDWTGSGIWRAGLFRNGVWLIDNNGDFQYNTANGDYTLTRGVAGDRPIPSDLFGFGRHAPNVYRPSSGAWITEFGTVGVFGGSTSLPIAAPWQ